MSSNVVRGIRRKKSSLTEVKIAIIGAPGVGKSGEGFKVFLEHLLLLLFYVAQEAIAAVPM